jgi:hypothetical protein
MQSAEFRRVEADLQAVKAALGTELPYDGSHVALYFLGAGLGVLLLLLPLLGLEAHFRSVLLAGCGVMVAAWGVQIRYLRARRVEAPARWRWGRKELAASVVAIILLVGYVVWVATVRRRQGQWDLREGLALASSVLFFLGTAGLAWVAADRVRWSLLGASMVLVLAGLLVPLCETLGQFQLLVGGTLFLGGLSSGFLLLGQLRRREVGHAD